MTIMFSADPLSLFHDGVILMPRGFGLVCRMLVIFALKMFLPWSFGHRLAPDCLTDYGRIFCGRYCRLLSDPELEP